MTESDKITIDELRSRLGRAEANLTKCKEAIDLWNALELRTNQQVSSATLLAKTHDFDQNTVGIATSVTDGCDWIEQIGLINTALVLIHQAEIGRDDED